MFSKKEFAIVSNLRFTSRTNFMLSWVEHEKKFYNLGTWICYRSVKLRCYTRCYQRSLRWPNTLGRVSSSFWQGRQLLGLPVWFPVYQTSEKASTLKGKAFLPSSQPLSRKEQNNVQLFPLNVYKFPWQEFSEVTGTVEHYLEQALLNCVGYHGHDCIQLQSNLNGSNIFGTMEIRSRHG